MRIGHLKILIDTREKKPFIFQGSKKVALEVGDYSIHGYIKMVAVERKSLGDFLSCVSKQRFKQQIRNLLKRPHRVIVVEGSMNDFNKFGFAREETIASFSSLVVSLGVPIVFCATRRLAQLFTFEYLKNIKKRIDLS
jgi:ERCC4-type nuclease